MVFDEAALGAQADTPCSLSKPRGCCRSEQSCLAACTDRYGDATQIVTKAVLEMNGMQ